MIVQDVRREKGKLTFDFLASKAIEVETVDEYLSTDGGLLVLRELDERWGLTAGFAAQLLDPRARGCWHGFESMVQQRVYGILAGYVDQNDHEALRHDAVFKLVAGRSPDDRDLASQPTLSRFENAITARMLLQLEAWFLEQFVQSFSTPPPRITLDVDLFDEPTHGAQQLTFFHGFYNQYQYQVRLITCAENEHVVLPALLYGTARATLGVMVDLEQVVAALRERFPDVVIHLRMDSGFASPAVYEACERLRIDDTIGLAMNAVLKAGSAAELQAAEAAFAETQQPQRRFTAWEYQAESWPQPRWVVVKCEVQALGTNRRAVVTNRPGARVLPQGAYEEYADRGESENRNKELKCELSADRLSDHRYMANCFRMYLHCMAYQLLVRARQVPCLPPPEPAANCAVPPVANPVVTPVDESPAADPSLPPEAWTGARRRKRFNQRRKRDPLGEGHACTWRQRLIKVAAWIVVRARRIVVQLTSSWPYLEHYFAVGRAAVSLPTR